MRSRIMIYLIFFLFLTGAMFGFQYWNFRIPEPFVDHEYDYSLRETDGLKHIIDLSDLVSAGAPQDNIPAIDQPKFEGVDLADVYLKDDGHGLDVAVGGRHRFYPYQLLVWHEIVNDTFNNRPILVTYCPLCESGAVFEREFGGQILHFGTSGRLWNNNLIMYDRETLTWWSQILGQAVAGQWAGLKLERVPAQVMTWDAWKKAYPDGEVLTRDTGVERDYTRDPYGDYYENFDVHFALTHHDDRLRVKDRIYGLPAQEPNSYLKAAISGEQVINDDIGGQPVVLLYNEELQATRAFLREVNGQILTFSLNEGKLVDEQSQSQWSANGLALSGEWQGIQLEEIPLIPAFWFCWSAAYPNTNLHLP